MKSIKGLIADENYSDRDIMSLAIQGLTEDGEDTPDDLEILLAKKNLLNNFQNITQVGLMRLYGLDLQISDEFERLSEKNNDGSSICLG